MQKNRSVAQPGSAPYWGCGGRGFKSRRSDHFLSALILFKVSAKNNFTLYNARILYDDSL
jgi:hypothetical protein